MSAEWRRRERGDHYAGQSLRSCTPGVHAKTRAEARVWRSQILGDSTGIAVSFKIIAVLCQTPVPWHIAGIYRPRPVLSEEQRNTGCGFVLTVITNELARPTTVRVGCSAAEAR